MLRKSATTPHNPREESLAVRPEKQSTEKLLAHLLADDDAAAADSLGKELVSFLRANLTAKISARDLLRFDGVDEAKALRIVAALELGGRFRINRDKLKVYAAGRGQFICGDCLDGLHTLADDSIVLAFTSPPYHNAVNYSEHVRKLRGEVRRWERGEQSYAHYKTFLVDRFKELFRVMKPGGHNVVNLSPVAWDGKRVALPFHFVSWMEEIGWQFKEDIIWEKGVVKDKRSGVLMQHPYPGYYYPSLAVEYVLVFQKTAAKKSQNNIYHDRSAKEKRANKIALDEYQMQSKNIWNIRPVAPSENIHPCPFPQELARRVIQYYSYKGDTVLDIFAGSGVTGLTAEKLGRKHIGMETELHYVEYALGRINEAMNNGGR